MEHKIVPCLWFDTQAEEAAQQFYVCIFKNSRTLAVVPYPEGSPGPAGTAMTVEFELDGERFLAINGGPQFPFTEPCRSRSSARPRTRSTTSGIGCVRADRRSSAGGSRTDSACRGR